MLAGVSVEVPPNGTRGGTMPRMPGPLMRFFNNAIFFVFRGRPFMGLQLLMLTTLGARSGQPRRSTLGFYRDGEKDVGDRRLGQWGSQASGVALQPRQAPRSGLDRDWQAENKGPARDPQR